MSTYKHVELRENFQMFFLFKFGNIFLESIVCQVIICQFFISTRGERLKYFVFK